MLNTAGLLALGIAETASDPLGGWYERDAAGRLTGRLDEYAELGALRRLYSTGSERALVADLRAYADSALIAPLGTFNCARYFRAYEARAKANLALGDTAAARADLVLAVAIWPQDGARRDSASAMLGSRFNASAFDVATDSTRRAFGTCVARVQIERRAAKQKRSLP